MAEIRVNATGGLKLFDADDSHYAQIIAGTITSNTDVMTLGHAAVVMGTKLDLNGNNLILDADADTYLDGGTADDVVDVYVAGAKDWKFGANSINVLSGTTLTIDSGATITNSGTANGFGSADPASADGDTLGTASLEWSDLFLADGGIIKFGNDQDTLLTHTDGTGLTLNSTNKLCFNDASQFVQGSSATVLSIGATDEIDLTATAVDLNGTLDVSGTTTLGGTLTVNAGAVFNEASADVDFRVESNGNANMLTVNAGSDLVGIGADPDLGRGLHIKSGESSASVNASAQDLVIECGSGQNSGMSILSEATSEGNVFFGDNGDNDIGKISYDHNTNALTTTVNAATVMKIDSTGAVTMPLQPAFLVKKNAESDVGTGAVDIGWDTEVFDVNADFGSNVFTAPVTGKYQINLQIEGVQVDSAGSYVEMMIRLSNRDLQEVFRNSLQLSSDGGVNFQINQLCDMDANDTATARIQFVGGHSTSDIGGSYSFFSGFLAC